MTTLDRMQRPASGAEHCGDFIQETRKSLDPGTEMQLDEAQAPGARDPSDKGPQD